MQQDSLPRYQVRAEKNVYVTMRDGVRLAVDIYRPDAEGKFPALLAVSGYGKALQVLPQKTQVRSQGAILWDGCIEAGETEYIVPRGYVQVIGDLRGCGESEGEYLATGDPNIAKDGYDLVEWIAQQPWCDGNVGMIGISFYAMYQVIVAAEHPPHLKALFPFEVHLDQDPTGVIGSSAYRLFSGRPMDPGPINGSGFAPRNMVSGVQRRLPREEYERLWQERLNDPDLMQYSIFWSVLRYPCKNPLLADVLLNGYDDMFGHAVSLEEITVPLFTGGPWNNTWAEEAFRLYNRTSGPKKALIVPPGSVDRPWRSQHEEMMRWMDYWLKGIQNGIMDEPPIKIFVLGANEWRYEQEWPLARTRWTKLYLRSWKRLLPEPSPEDDEPDCFVQEPPSQTFEVNSVKYATSPLPRDTEITGPVALYLHGAIDTDDTNWNVTLRDLDEHGNATELLPGTDCWLKASWRALDETESTPWKPRHRGTKQPVTPGQVYEYAFGLGDISTVAKAGHRLELVIASMDNRPGYLHICSSKTTLHKIYHGRQYPSHLLLPMIP